MKYGRLIFVVWGVFSLLGFGIRESCGETYYVDATKSDDSGDGLSWASAKQTIQAGVDTASAGDTVLVTNGVYALGGSAPLEFRLTNRVSITKALTVRSVNGPDVTFISGSRSPAVRCALLSTGAQLVGFTLTNGYTRPSGWLEDAGGGVLCFTADALVSNCVIRNCEAQGQGGGINGGIIRNCLIENNAAENGGGVSDFAYVYDSTVRSNSAVQWGGGAYYCVSFVRSVIEYNTSEEDGGGLALCQASCCTIDNNYAAEEGGGIWYPGSEGTMIKYYNSCLIKDNTAGLRGGGVHSGGAYAQDDLKLYNCTVVNNTATQEAGGVMWAYLRNTIVWSNYSDLGTDDASQCLAYYSCAPELNSGFNGSITNNPLFAGSSTGNYRLGWTSPCRNAGDDGMVYTTTDLDGNVRVVCTNIDMGAYEYQQCERPAPVITQGPSISNITSSGAKIQWQTDQDCDSTVLLGSSGYGFNSSQSSSALTAQHMMVLTGLSARTAYRWAVVSRNDSGGAVTSGASFLQTQPVAPEQVFLNTNLLVSAGDRFPAIFAAESSGDVERVRFYLDGRLIGTAFDAPFNTVFDPRRAGMAASEVFGAHTVTVEAVDSLGAVTTVHMDWMSRVSECFNTEYVLDVWRPSSDQEFIIGNGVPNPPTNVEILVNAKVYDGIVFEATDFPGSMGPEADSTEFLAVSNWVDPERIEFYVDDVLMDTQTNSMEEMPDYYSYNCDVSSMTTGAHEIIVKMITTNGCVFTRSKDFYLNEADVDIRWERVVERVGSTFITHLTLTNASARAVDVTQVTDLIRGFQAGPVYPPSGGEVQMQYLPNSHTEKMVCTFDPPKRMEVGETFYFMRYETPMLFPEGNRYALGGYSTVNVTWSNETTRMFRTSRTARQVYNSTNGTTQTVSAAWTDALKASDYMIVVNPDRMMTLYPTNDVFALMEKAGELAWRRGGVMACYNSRRTQSTRYRDRNLSTFIDGNIIRSWYPSLMATASRSASNIYAYCYDGEVHDSGFTLTGVEMREGDRLLAGNWFSSLSGSPDPADELLLMRGSRWGSEYGTAEIFYYNSSAGELTNTVSWTFPGYSNSCAAIMADVAVGWSAMTPDQAELITLAPDGTLTLDNYSYHGVEVEYETDFGEGDILAAGYITAEGGHDDLVVGDVDEDQLVLIQFEWGGYPTAMQMHTTAVYDVELEADDRILTANLNGGLDDEIIVYDHSHGLLRCYEYASDVNRIMRFGMISDVGELDDDDMLFAGRFSPTAMRQFVRVNGAASDEGSVGDLNVYLYDGSERLGSREVLRSLIINGWDGQLSDDWADDGRVLLIGEDAVVPAFSAFYGSSWIRETDRMYANVSGSAARPELSVGRIIGDTAERLCEHMDTILDQARGSRINTMDSAYVVSGHPTGISGTAHSNNYVAQCNQITTVLEGGGYDVIRDRTDGASGVALADLFARAQTNDVFLFAGHGNWNLWDITQSGNVNTGFRPPTNRCPLIVAKTCVSGRYSPGFSHGEAFNRHGSIGYIGASESINSSRGLQFCKELCRQLDSNTELGDSLKATKRARSGIDGGNDFICDVYHLYGDPASLLRHPRSRAPRKMRAPSDTEFTGPTNPLVLHLPMYQVETNAAEGEAAVFIDGQTIHTVEGIPAVPVYTVFVTYPTGTVLQGVTMTDRSGLQTASGLALPAWHDNLDDAGHTRARGGAPVSGFWPDQDFFWWVDNNPDGSSVLILTLYPFYYNTNTQQAMYYTNYTFALESIETALRINRIAMDHTAYDTGDTVRITGWIEASGQSAPNVVVQTSIYSNDWTLCETLPLQSLEDITGLVSYNQAWATARDPGTYTLETLIKDTSDQVLARDIQEFTVGLADAYITNFVLVPDAFSRGDNVGLCCRAVNDGSRALDGTVVLEIQDAFGNVVDTLFHSFSNLNAGSYLDLKTIWTNQTLCPRNCQIRGYISYDARSSDPKQVSNWQDAPLLLGNTTFVDDDIYLNWPSVSGRMYAVEYSTNLVEGSYFLPLQTNIPATPPDNEFVTCTNFNDTFFRLVETLDE